MNENVQLLVGNRLKQLLNLAGLTQQQFAEKYGFTQSQVNKWLLGKGSIYLVTAKKLIEALNQEGVVCTIDFLLEEEPPVPDVLGKTIPAKFKSKNLPLQEDEFIRQQIMYLKKLDPNYITLRLTDDAMKPIFNRGDYIGGSEVFGVDIQKLSGSICLLETIDGEKLLRQLYYNKHDKVFEGKSFNEQAYPSITIPVSKLLSAAKVIWHIHLG